MPLTEEEIREFQQIIREETGVELSRTEAWNRAIELIALVRMIIGPVPEDLEAPPSDAQGSNVVQLAHHP